MLRLAIKAKSISLMMVMAFCLPAKLVAQNEVAANSAAPLGTMLDPTLPPFPLRPFEKLYPFKNGCNVIDHANDTRLSSYWASRSWLGACWFGLAHGPGFATWHDPAAKAQERYNFIYGFAWPNIFRNADSGKYSDYRIGFERNALYVSNKNGISQLTIDENLNILSFLADGNYARHIFSIRRISCGLGWKNPTLLMNAKQAAEEEKTLCKLVKNQKVRAGVAPLQLLYVDHSWATLQANHVKIPNTDRFQVFMCLPRKGDVVDPAIAAATPQCSATFARVLAPFRTAIDDIITNDAKRRDEAIADARARGAPFEAHWRAWQRQAAARLHKGR